MQVFVNILSHSKTASEGPVKGFLAGGTTRTYAYFTVNQLLTEGMDMCVKVSVCVSAGVFLRPKQSAK